MPKHHHSHALKEAIIALRLSKTKTKSWKASSAASSKHGMTLMLIADLIRACSKNAHKRLEAVVKANGGYIEEK